MEVVNQMFKDFLWGKKKKRLRIISDALLSGYFFIFGDIYLNKNVFWLVYITATEEPIVKRQPFKFTEACAMPI